MEETKGQSQRNNAPVVTGGLFGGNALKDDEPPAQTTNKSKLNSIFDYEDSDEEKKQAPMM